MKQNRLKSIASRLLKLFEEKNKKYGDSYRIAGSIGIAIRLSDKYSRLLTINKEILKQRNKLLKLLKLENTKAEIKNLEALAEVAVDSAVYSMMLLDELERLGIKLPLPKTKD